MKRYLPPLLLGLLLVAVVLRFGDLRQPGLCTGDEALTALRSQGLIEHGHWWTPYWNGEPDDHKPPFYYWCVALGYTLLGVGELPIRLPSVISFVILSVLLYRIGKRLFDPWTGLLAVCLLAAHPIFVQQARVGMMDVTMTCLFMGAVWCLLRAAESPRHYLGWGACCGAALLTKSYAAAPVLAASLLYVLALRRPALRAPRFYTGLALALVLPGVWFGSQYCLHRDAVLTPHYQDLVGYRFHHALLDKSVYSISITNLWASWGGLAPFVVAATALLWMGRDRTPEHSARREVCLIYLVGILTLMAISSVKQQMPWYVLPVVAPMALLGARTAVRMIAGHGSTLFRLLCCTTLVIGALLPHAFTGADLLSRMVLVAALLAALLGFGRPLLRRTSGFIFLAGLALAVAGGMSPQNQHINRIRLRDAKPFMQIARLLPSQEEIPGPVVTNFRHYPQNTICFYAHRDFLHLRYFSQFVLRPGERYVAVIQGENYEPLLPVARVRKLHTVGDMSILVLDGPERESAPRD